MKIKITRRLRMRFLRHVEMRGGQDRCWRWKGAKDAAGYGRFTMGSAGVIAPHRLSYVLYTYAKDRYGEIIDTNDLPTIGHIDECIGRSCVNPAHLAPGRYTNRKYGTPAAKYILD